MMSIVRIGLHKLQVMVPEMLMMMMTYETKMIIIITIKMMCYSEPASSDFQQFRIQLRQMLKKRPLIKVGFDLFDIRFLLTRDNINFNEVILPQMYSIIRECLLGIEEVIVRLKKISIFNRLRYHDNLYIETFSCFPIYSGMILFMGRVISGISFMSICLLFSNLIHIHLPCRKSQQLVYHMIVSSYLALIS